MKQLLAGILAMAAGYAAAAEFSGNVTYATDYRFRGISQVDRSQAIQGGFDIELDSGLYFGTWASNVGNWSGGTIEVDYYGGYAMDLSESTSADVGVIYYGYPEDDADPDLDYVEVYGSLSFRTLRWAPPSPTTTSPALTPFGTCTGLLAGPGGKRFP